MRLRIWSRDEEFVLCSELDLLRHGERMRFHDTASAAAFLRRVFMHGAAHRSLRSLYLDVVTRVRSTSLDDRELLSELAQRLVHGDLRVYTGERRRAVLPVDYDTKGEEATAPVQYVEEEPDLLFAWFEAEAESSEADATIEGDLDVSELDASVEGEAEPSVLEASVEPEAEPSGLDASVEADPEPNELEALVDPEIEPNGFDAWTEPDAVAP